MNETEFLKCIRDNASTPKSAVSKKVIQSQLKLDDRTFLDTLQTLLYESKIRETIKGNSVYLTNIGSKSLKNSKTVSVKNYDSEFLELISYLKEEKEIAIEKIQFLFPKVLENKTRLYSDLNNKFKNIEIDFFGIRFKKTNTNNAERTPLSVIFSNAEEKYLADFMNKDFFSFEGLKKLLSDEEYEELRERILQHFGALGRVSKKELSDYIVCIHGTEIFSSKKGHGFRELFIKALGVKVKNPIKWRPGGRVAREFIESISQKIPKILQDALVGVPRIKKDSYEYFPAMSELPGLLDYQIKASSLVNKNFNLDQASMLVMPTGTGKTRTAIDIINNWFDRYPAGQRSVVIWLAHSDILCEQFIQEFTKVLLASKKSYPVRLFRMWNFHKSEHDQLDIDIEEEMSTDGSHIVIVSTNTSLRNLLQSDEQFVWVRKILMPLQMLLVIDEAHRAGAETYKEAIALSKKSFSKVCVLGLTATPKRASGTESEDVETAALFEIFGGEKNAVNPFVPDGKVSYRNLIEMRSRLLNEQILSVPVFLDRVTTIKVSKPLEELAVKVGEDYDLMGQFDEEYKSFISENYDRRVQVVEVILQQINESNNPAMIYFASDVNDAKQVHYHLRSNGVNSAFMDANTPTSSRLRMISDLKSGKISIICNCEVLTQGFDYPKITNIIIGRPTISTVLYEQMIGRGLRGPRFGGTDKCTVIDIIDKTSDDVLEKLAFMKVRREWNEVVDKKSNSITKKLPLEKARTAVEPVRIDHEKIKQLVLNLRKKQRRNEGEDYDLAVLEKFLITGDSGLVDTVLYILKYNQ